MEPDTKKKKADRKVVILGDSGVGKTCLIRRYIEGIFTDGSPNTIGAAFFLKQWNSKNIALWDTAGQEEFSGLTSFYCRNANAVILCYDLTCRETFDTLMERHSRLLESVARNCLMVFVGTKFDMLNKKISGKLQTRGVTPKEIMDKSSEYTQRFNSLHHPKGIPPVFETSSKSDYNVSDVFEYIFETLAPVEGANKSRDTSPSGLIELNNERSGNQEGGKQCC